MPKTRWQLRCAVRLINNQLSQLKLSKAPDKTFLTRLKAMLPNRCRPVIVTDAGFKVPWFKEVSALGWHFIGRVRGKVSIRLPDQSEFISIAKVYKQNGQQPMVLGEIALGQSQEYACRAVLAGKGWKLRKKDKHHSYKEPWLLVSNLAYCFNYANKINKHMLRGCKSKKHSATRKARLMALAATLIARKRKVG